MSPRDSGDFLLQTLTCAEWRSSWESSGTKCSYADSGTSDDHAGLAGWFYL
jgi:hypothetical protein